MRRSRTCKTNSDIIGTWKNDLPRLWILEATKRNNTAISRDGEGQLVKACLTHLKRLHDVLNINSRIIPDFCISVLQTFASDHLNLYEMPIMPQKIINGIPIEAQNIHFYNTFLKEKFATLPQLYCNTGVIRNTITSKDNAYCILYTGVSVGNIHEFKPNAVETLMR